MIFIEKLWEKRKSGYYFKGNFISEYKHDALEILREKFKDYSDEEKKKYKDEWSVINYEYSKQQAALNKTRKKKKSTIFFQSNTDKKIEKAKLQKKSINNNFDYLLRRIIKLETDKLDYSILNSKLNKIEERMTALESRPSWKL